jgi:hypothetical protein
LVRNTSYSPEVFHGCIEIPFALVILVVQSAVQVVVRIVVPRPRRKRVTWRKLGTRRKLVTRQRIT